MKTFTMPAATGIQDENTKDISILNPAIPVISGSGDLTIAMTCAAPEGTPPRRFNELKTPNPAFQEALVRMAVVPLHFHGSGANSRSCMFPMKLN
jgi:hypothetical protein